MLQTITSGLSALASTIMGDASMEQQECILAILPFPEPTDLIDKIEKKHPNVKFLWHTLNFIPGRQQIDAKKIDNDCTSTTHPA